MVCCSCCTGKEVKKPRSLLISSSRIRGGMRSDAVNSVNGSGSASAYLYTRKGTCSDAHTRKRFNGEKEDDEAIMEELLAEEVGAEVSAPRMQAVTGDAEGLCPGVTAEINVAGSEATASDGLSGGRETLVLEDLSEADGKDDTVDAIPPIAIRSVAIGSEIGGTPFPMLPASTTEDTVADPRTRVDVKREAEIAVVALVVDVLERLGDITVHAELLM